MTERWTEVDQYLTELVVRPDAALDEAVSASEAAGLPQIQVSPPLGKLLHLLARMCDARKILEIGTLGGYSTIWLARALPPDGSLVTLEVDPQHAEVARSSLEKAGMSETVDIRVGAALETLPRLETEGLAPFDFVFIDADKPNNSEYFRWAMRLGRPGTVIVVDNVVRHGDVIDGKSADEAVIGTRKLFELLSKEPKIDATAVQTVGSKGYDGFAIAIVGQD